MFGLFKAFRFWLCVSLIGLVAGLCVLVVIFHSRATAAESKSSQLQSDNDLQAKVIAQRALTFQRFNEIAAATERQTQTTTMESEKRVVIYREKLVRVKAADELINNDVACGLLDYANRLRSAAVRGATENANESGNRTVTACKLTYRQAVLWIDPLLSALDEANGKLYAIQQAEKARLSK